MTYAFKRKDRTATEGARRIALGQIDHAIGLVDGPPLSEADIHSLRTTIKKLRGLVRLIRPGLDAAATEDAALRDAGRAISAPRDSEVMVATLSLLAPEGLPQLRAALDAAHAEARADGVLDAGLVTYRVALLAARERARGWKVAGKGFDALHTGVKDTFGGARKAMRLARKQPLPGPLHEARKLIKAHGYQTRLLRPIWPGMMAAHLAAATELGETLGQMNDLSMFEERLALLPLPDAERVEAITLARARHKQLAAAAFPLAARLLAERPKNLSRRWQAWWTIWRAEG